MKALDRVLQRWRIRKARPFVPPGSRVLDVGCYDGLLFHKIPNIAGGVGIDPALGELGGPDFNPPHGVRLVSGHFPADLPDSGPFDVITMLAVLEHFPAPARDSLGDECARRLRAGGRLILTVPSTRVDALLHLLKRVRLIDGMALEEHSGFDPDDTPSLFDRAGFRLLESHRFQLGLNRLFVFQRN